MSSFPIRVNALQEQIGRIGSGSLRDAQTGEDLRPSRCHGQDVTERPQVNDMPDLIESGRPVLPLHAIQLSHLREMLP